MALHRITDVRQGDTQHAQLLTVIFQPPFHRSSPAQLYLINSRQTCQTRLDMFLRILLNQYRSGRSIQSKGHERTGRILIGDFHPYNGIADAIGQLRPCLADNGGSFETHRIYIGMLVQLHGDIAKAVSGSGIQFLHSTDTRQHRFQLTGDLHLHHPRRCARHAETYRKARQTARRIQLDRKERYQRYTYQSQTDKCHYDGERRGRFHRFMFTVISFYLTPAALNSNLSESEKPEAKSCNVSFRIL